MEIKRNSCHVLRFPTRKYAHETACDKREEGGDELVSKKVEGSIPSSSTKITFAMYQSTRSAAWLARVSYVTYL